MQRVLLYILLQKQQQQNSLKLLDLTICYRDNFHFTYCFFASDLRRMPEIVRGRSLVAANQIWN